MKRWIQRLFNLSPCWHSRKHLFYYQFIWGSYAECAICGDHPTEDQL